MKKTTIFILALAVAFGMGFTFKTVITDRSKNLTEMKRVTGIGGIFFKCKNPHKVKDWYKTHLGFIINPWGGTSFEWRLATDSSKKGSTEWSTFPDTTKYFEPSTKDFMINYRVENLEALVVELKKEGVTIVDKMETYDYGKFIHIMDIEGNKIELWEPSN